jgi:hypothetical protein
MWQGLVFAVLQSAAPAGLVVDGAVLTEDVIGSLVTDYALRLDVTVTNLTDEAQCIQRSDLDAARWTIRDIATGEALSPRMARRASQREQGSIMQIKPGDTKAFGIELFAVYQFEESRHYDVVGSLLTTPCELDEAGRPQWELNDSDARYLSVAYSLAPNSAVTSHNPVVLNFVGSRFDDEDLIVSVRNEGEAAICVPHNVRNPSQVHVTVLQTGRRIPSPAGTFHFSRNMLHRIAPAAELDIRIQMGPFYDLDAMFDYRFSGEFDYALCSQYQVNDSGFARPVDGQASVLTYIHETTTD